MQENLFASPGLEGLAAFWQGVTWRATQLSYRGRQVLKHLFTCLRHPCSSFRWLSSRSLGGGMYWGHVFLVYRGDEFERLAFLQNLQRYFHAGI